MSKQLIKKTYYCPIELTIDLVGGKWKPLIMVFLREKPRRFGELKRLIPAVTEKMLTQQLRDLEQDHLVERKVYSETPLRVEYSLSENGRGLGPILDAMNEYGSRHASQYSVEMQSLDFKRPVTSQASTTPSEAQPTSAQEMPIESEAPLN